MQFQDSTIINIISKVHKFIEIQKRAPTFVLASKYSNEDIDKKNYK